jgi:predicted amidohydrolase
MVKLSAIQLCSQPDVSDNLAAIDNQLAQLVIAKQHLVLLPECCLCFGGEQQAQLTLAKNTAENQRLHQGLAALARTYRVTLVAGTIPVLSRSGDKFTNTSCVFGPDGAILASYDKIHLFDVAVKDNARVYCESHYTLAGKAVSLVQLPFANVGLTVCYDVRFPELYRQLTEQGADIITVPSAFTQVTGQAHWQVLLQARAIENQVYIIAAGQQGRHANGRETWGHSMIVSPWGEILTCLATGEGAISTEYKVEEIQRVRASMPVSKHNQFNSRLRLDKKN